MLGADGAMIYQWGETCGGWTVEQRFRLRLEYADQDATEISSNLVTWESKDGSRYRFNERRMRNGELDQQIKGEAHINIPQSYLLGFDAVAAKLNGAARARPSNRPSFSNEREPELPRAGDRATPAAPLPKAPRRRTSVCPSGAPRPCAPS